MSGPFGNPAMVSSGGGGGPHLSGALQFGTKGSNPALGGVTNAALGVIDMTSWFSEVASRNGGTVGYAYLPYSTTVSFWIKGYVSNSFYNSTPNYPLGGNPSGQSPTLTFMGYDGGSRDSISVLYSRSLAGYGGTLVGSIDHYKNYGWSYWNQFDQASTTHDTVVNGATAGWDHILIQADWHLNSTDLGTKVSGVTEPQSVTIYVNGIQAQTQYYQRSFDNAFEGYNYLWADFASQNGFPYATFVNNNAWHDVNNDGASYIVRFFTNESGGAGAAGPLANGYHGLLANFQIFPWRVEPAELGYNNAGVWSSKAYEFSWRQNAYYMQMDRSGGTANQINWNNTFGHYGELWGMNYDFSDPSNWHQDMSGNGQHFFTSLGPNNTNPNASGYITHQTNDLPPM